MSVRILKLGHVDSGIDRDGKNFELGFKTWIDEKLCRELVSWAETNLTSGYDLHPRAHSWSFHSKYDFDAFLNHRPMQVAVSLLDTHVAPGLGLSGNNRFPFGVAEYATVNYAYASKTVDETRRVDWLWDDIEQWVIENALGRVAKSANLPGETRLSMWDIHYGFERADDAVCFRARWTDSTKA